MALVNGVTSDWAPVVFGAPFLAPCSSPCTLTTYLLTLSLFIRLFIDVCVCYRDIKNKEVSVKLQKEIDRL